MFGRKHSFMRQKNTRVMIFSGSPKPLGILTLEGNLNIAKVEVDKFHPNSLVVKDYCLKVGVLA